MFTIAARQSRWPKLVLACRALATDDADLHRRGAHMLDSVLASWSRSFTVPSAGTLSELQELAPKVRGKVPDRTLVHIDDIVRHAG